MEAPNTNLYLPALLAGALALGVGSLAFLPDASLAPSFALVDHDDSVHPLSEVQLTAVRVAFAATAALFAGLAAFMAGSRGRSALAHLGQEASAVLQQLRPPATASFGVILLAGLLVRVALLDGPMRFDESDTFDYFASRSFFNLLTDYTAPNNHILHTALVRISYLLFGHSPPALRLPALAAGILLLPLTFLLARRLFSERAAYLAMALAAVHPGLVEYSANARGYTLLCCFTLTVFLAASFLRQARNRFAWLLFVAAGALGMFTIPVMLYPLSAASVWALWSAEPARRRALLGEITLAAAVIAGASLAFYAPAAARTGAEAIVANRYVTAMSWQKAAGEAQDLFTDGWMQWTNHLSAPVWLALGAALLFGFREREARRLAAAVLVTALAWMAVQRVIPYARVFLYAAPLVAIAAAAGLQRFGSRSWLPPALAGGLALHLYLGSLWFPTSGERTSVELRAAEPILLEAAEQGVPILAALPFSEPIRYTLLTSGRPRSQTLAPDVVSGALPPLDQRQELILVRPTSPDPQPGYWIDLDAADFASFPNRETIIRGENLEILRLVRE